jgi:anthranilate phosphoribosyltransferase
MAEADQVDIGASIRTVASGIPLTRDEAATVMASITSGRVSDIQIAGLLAALRTRGETTDEVVGFAEAMRARCVRVHLPELQRPIVDTCGTGGDGHGTFNVSTTAALVVAGAGVHVAKHGNRAQSSQTGSADLLQALGATVSTAPEDVAEQVAHVGFGFMLAPEYHPAMRFVMPVRRGLGTPTVFNILGPLLNPAGVLRQVIGVRDRATARLMATALAHLGSERVLMVTSSEGTDELTLAGLNHVVDLNGETGDIAEYTVDAADLGFAHVSLDAIQGGDAHTNAGITRSILDGTAGPHRDTVLLNAGAALVAAGLAETIGEGAEMAGAAIDSGAARNVLNRYVEVSGGVKIGHTT